LQTDSRFKLANSQTLKTADTKTAVQSCPSENAPVKTPSARLVQRKSQSAALLRLLTDAHGSWVPLPKVLALGIAQYNARVFELRRLGFAIENKTERVDGARHSWFRLVNSPAWKDRRPSTGLPLWDAQQP
jgi:hypothetical protein